jgi:parallel beta-helix repeat protein
VLTAFLLAVMQFPPGVTVVRKEIVVPAGTRVAGHPKGSTLRAAANFRGRALLVCGRGVTVENLVLDGNRAKLERRAEIAPHDRDFIGYYDRNGLIADGADNLTIRKVVFRNIANFAAIVARSRRVTFDEVVVEDSGSLNRAGRNNTSGGLLLEEGTTDFVVRRSRFLRIRGNAVWTHSRYESPRNGPGAIEHNYFEDIGRDALQAGHATKVRIERNTGLRIGWPFDVVDVEGGGTPVGIDTAGNVDKSVYAENRFDEINGKCIDLDGFHDGEVRANVCINRGVAADYPVGHFGIVFNNTNPDMQSSGIRVTGNTIDGTKYGGIFVIGHGNTVQGNTLRRLNLARCNDTAGCVWDSKQPDLLRSGIYIGSRAERPAPARDNVVTDNSVSGWGMDRYCVVAAPDVDIERQSVARNDCRNSTP